MLRVRSHDKLRPYRSVSLWCSVRSADREAGIERRIQHAGTIQTQKYGQCAAIYGQDPTFSARRHYDRPILHGTVASAGQQPRRAGGTEQWASRRSAGRQSVATRPSACHQHTHCATRCCGWDRPKRRPGSGPRRHVTSGWATPPQAPHGKQRAKPPGITLRCD